MSYRKNRKQAKQRAARKAKNKNKRNHHHTESNESVSSPAIIQPRPPLLTEKHPGILYLAYGSNLHMPQMGVRCPGSVPEATVTLKNWRMVFRNVADIIPAEGFVVKAGLYSVTPENEEALDIYEGTDSGLYYKVDFPLSDGRRAFFYKMSPWGLKYDVPSADYYKTIAEGFDHWGFDQATLKEALKHAWQESPLGASNFARRRRIRSAEIAKRHRVAIPRISGKVVEES